MLKQLFFAFFILSFNLSATESNSQKYASFNKDSVERQNFVKEQNGKVNSRLKTSANFLAVKKEFSTYGTGFPQSEIKAKNGKTYTLFDQGMGKSHILEEKSEDGTAKVIFNSATLSRNNIYNAVAFALSPNETRAIILFNHKGSTEDRMFVTIDLETQKVVYQSPDDYLDRSFIFRDEKSLITWQEKDGTYRLATVSIEEENKPEVILDNLSDYQIMGQWILATNNTNEQFLISTTNIISLGKTELALSSINEQSIYFQTLLENKTREFYQFNFNDKKLVKLFSVADTTSEATFLANYILLNNSLGFKTNLTAYSLDGKKLSSVEIPSACNAIDFQEKKDIQSISITLAGLRNSREFLWNLNEENPVISSEAIDGINKIGDKNYIVEDKLAKSFDGTMVPYRMIYQEGTALKNAGVYIDTYGGFNYVNIKLGVSAYIVEYIKRGGVYIESGIRGGGELGQAWHKAAMKENKIKSYEDLASIAKSLIDDSITTKERIVLTGSSNGGLTTAATGLLFPEYFGLVIPHNGVLDMLAKEELDPQYNFGWSYEYGDSRDEAMGKYMMTYSPVEICNQNKKFPQMLILNGRTDTRVNPAHSIKLAAAMIGAGHVNVELVSITNSGHFNLSISQSDYIGWRMNIIKWSTIYDFLKIKY